MKQHELTAKKKPQRSLRTMLMLWLLLFSVTPLAFLTGYSLVKYEQSNNRELAQRLSDNDREIQVIFQEFQSELQTRNWQHAREKTLAYYLSVNSINNVRDLASKWMKGQFTHRLSIFNREGRLLVALAQNPKGEVIRQEKLETGDVFLSENFLKKANEHEQQAIIDFTKDSTIDLVSFSKVLAANGSMVGYLEEVLTIDNGFVTALKNRMNLEVAFISEDGSKTLASQEDLEHYRQGFYTDKYIEIQTGLFELNIRGVPYGFMIEPVKWGEHKFYIAIGASKQAAMQVLKNVNVAFFSMVGAIVVLLTILSFIISKILLHPVNELVDVVQSVDFEKQPVTLIRRSDTELGILTSAFNEMIQRVYSAQKEQRDNIKKLEEANLEIRETQAKLVHTAKMASLGQLVAGVAHELNNPIGFIYSNMTHLREYSQRLIGLVRTAETSPSQFAKEKVDKEFDYIVEDMPKLIKSCEEGARRTRDIVLGLRNFSRLDEAKSKEVDIHEGIESTLALLAGEFKARIKITKKYGKLPLINCYPSQLNQVFMNILSNAAQAIKDQGEITITTKQTDAKHVEISISDNGIGMSDDTREKIFDPFFTTKEHNKGTGLGMSIAYGVIEKHHGRLQVNSVLGKGSEFVISLPISV
jgi:two-component system, NtrC family, sensor kinase